MGPLFQKSSTAFDVTCAWSPWSCYVTTPTPKVLMGVPLSASDWQALPVVIYKPDDTHAQQKPSTSNKESNSLSHAA